MFGSRGTGSGKITSGGRVWLRSLGLAGLLVGLTACQDAGPRVLVVGIDGATRKVIDPLLEAGELPNIAALQREGTHSAIRTDDKLLLSPRIWTSVATGREPDVHGIEDWVRKDPDGSLHLYESTDRRVHALWNILSSSGRSVGVVNWLQTHPPERIEGVMVSDHALEGSFEEQVEFVAQFDKGSAKDAPVAADSTGVVFTSPPEWARRVVDLEQVEGDLTGVPNPFAGAEWEGLGNLTAYFRSRYDNDQDVTRIALAIQEELHPDLLMVYLPGIDRVSHFLWNGIEPPKPPESEIERAKLIEFSAEKHRNALLQYYRFVDELLGKLLAGYGPEDLVLVMSDHGFEAGWDPVGTHDTDDARDGILLARGPGIPAGAEGATRTPVDIAPTVLNFLGLPLAEDMPGAVAFGEPRGLDRVATYDTSPIERERGGDGGTGDRIMQDLRSLGYVE